MIKQYTAIILLISAFLIFESSAISAQETVAPTVPLNSSQILPSDTTTQPMPTTPTEQLPPPSPQQFQQFQPQQIPPFPEEKDEHRDFIDPREIKDVLRQFKDIKREANRLMKKAKKLNLSNEIGQLNEIFAQISNLETTIKNTPVESFDREILQDFYDSQIWDKLNDIRIKVELPNEIKMMERDIKRLEKMMAKKSFAVEGIDVEKVKVTVATFKNTIEQAKNHLAQGNMEDAGEIMQSIHEEGAHPGEIMGVINRLGEITKQLKKFKSDEIKNEITEILEPVYSAVNADDWREANMLLNEIDRDFWRILNMAKSRPTINQDLRNRMQKLEEKLQIKIQQQEQNNLEQTKEQQSYYNKNKYSVSLLGNAFDAVLYLFGF